MRWNQVLALVHLLLIRWFHAKSFTKFWARFLAGCGGAPGVLKTPSRQCQVHERRQPAVPLKKDQHGRLHEPNGFHADGPPEATRGNPLHLVM